MLSYVLQCVRSLCCICQTSHNPIRKQYAYLDFSKALNSRPVLLQMAPELPWDSFLM